MTENNVKKVNKGKRTVIIVASFLALAVFAHLIDGDEANTQSETDTISKEDSNPSKDIINDGQTAFAEEGVSVIDVNGNKVEPKTTYKILEESSLSNIKYTYEIGLSNNKLSKEELGQLAKTLKRKLDKDYERIFISYYLPGVKVGFGAWATTHFDPDLKVNILGRTEQEGNTQSSDCKSKLFKLEGIVDLISEDVEMIEDYHTSNSEEKFKGLIDGLIEVVEQTNLQSENDIGWALTCCPGIKEPLLEAMKNLELFAKAYKSYNSKKTQIKNYKRLINSNLDKAKSELEKCN